MKKTDYYEICNEKLKYLNYSDNSRKIYLSYISKFLNEITNPSRINPLLLSNVQLPI